LLPSDHPRVGAILLRYDEGRGLVMHCAILDELCHSKPIEMPTHEEQDAAGVPHD
jgi:hypothetical protein